MASALQCPACGFKHRLDALDGDPIFSCASCGRLLKTPVEYRRAEVLESVGAPAPSGASDAPGAVQRGGAATRDRTGVLPVPPAGPGADTRPRSAVRSTGTPRARPARSARAPIPAVAGLPLRILAWVVAFVLGALFVRWFAKATGILTGDSMLDIMTSTGWGRYVRVFVLVPVLALATAAFATLFIEGTRWWIHRRHERGVGGAAVPGRTTVPPAPLAPTPPIPPAATPAGVVGGSTGSDAARGATIPRRVPERSAVAPPEAGTLPESAQRPRRIPRRDTIS